MNRRSFLAAFGTLIPAVTLAQDQAQNIPFLRRRIQGHNIYFTPFNCAVDHIYPVRPWKDGDSPGFHTSIDQLTGEWKLEIMRPWFPDIKFKVRVDLIGGGKIEYDAVCRKEGVFFIELIA